jgi:cyclopropane-fatty-acyl-phospholipid synthase
MSGATILLDDRRATEADRAQPAPAVEEVAHPPRTEMGERRRRAVAEAVLAIFRKTIPDQGRLEVSMAGPGSDRRQRLPGARAEIVVRDPDALARLLVPPTGDAFAEAYLRGDIEIEGDVMGALEALQAINPRRLDRADVRRAIRWTFELRRGTPAAEPLTRISQLTGARHSRARDMAAIRFHYDVGESFYSLWLDQRMAYSCAYFPGGTTAATASEALDGAQEAKLDLIARKLRLGSGDRLLDIGSGWGSLLNFAAERYGVRTVGVTLSQRQADESNARAARAGLADRSVAHVRDYRDLAPLGSFDAVASVGMFEHVGRANLPTYFRAAYDAVKPGGLFLNHGIAGAGPRRRTGPRLRPTASAFLQRYVFPDGELVAVEDAVAIARATGFEILDVQSLRPHYALTLAAWVARLESHWAEAVATAGDEVGRTWRLYMSAARLGFERGELDVCQLLLAKPLDGRPASVPLRPWWR